MTKGRMPIGFCLLFALALCLSAGRAEAQYFGQNKVRYRSHDFKVLKTGHFDIHYYDEEREATLQFGRMAERWYARLKTAFGHELSGRQAIILYSSHPDFRGTTVLPEYIGETTGGVTEGLRRRIVMPLAGPLADTDHVLGHELVHAFQFDLTTRPGPIGGSGLPGALRLPLWFIEGMAEYLSVGAVDPHTAMWMRDAVSRDQLPPVSKLDDPRYFPYRWGQAFWAYLAGRFGDDVVARVLRAAGRAGTAEGALNAVLETDLEQLSKDWHQALKEFYRPSLAAGRPAADQAREIVNDGRGPGGLKVSPALSPDGKSVAFFSERDLFSIDIFLADTETGKIRRKITETAVDPHFDSLQFMNSAGAWNSDGSKFAFGGISGGRPEISIYDPADDSIARRIPLREVRDIFSLTWSPDGSSIAFSGMSGGYVDLFLLDLKTGEMRRLTDDPFAELQPAWSPDGRSIAFSTDRFGTDLSRLAFGELRLALLDPANGVVRPLQAFQSGKHLGAQWSRDGAHLYFIADRNGISNVYRMSVSGGGIIQVTNLQIGVSGISKWSPALSVASETDRLVFSGFKEGGYSLFVLEGPAALEGRSLDAGDAGMQAGLLPPSKRTGAVVSAYLEDAVKGLANADGFESSRYRPSLSLDYIAPPTVSVGMSSFGSLIGGGTALYFSDLLGHHNLMTAFQTSTTTEGGKFFNSLSGIVAYENQKTRWNWGFSGGQVPYVTGGYARSLALVDGQPVILDQATRFWEISRQASGILAMPLSRAQRLEFSGGFQNISYDAETRVEAFSATTGRFLGEQTFTPELPDSLNMAIGNAALVYDTSIFGGTSPILGQRYRLEAGIAAGTLKYSTVLTDYRRYLNLPGPLTLAGRLLHFGRYGGDSENPRLRDLSVGYPALVRGYEVGSFSADECVLGIDRSFACPTFDRLFGSRIIVANAELRLPLFGFRGIVPSRSAPPVEVAAFYDAGMAWRSLELARALGVPRKPVSSYGASLRFNVMGFFIGQLSYVYANDRPLRNWEWEFALNPGF